MLTRNLFSTKNYFSALWRTTESVKLLTVPEKVTVLSNFEAVRYRARKGTRSKALAAKKARKLQEANKPPPVPKYLQRKVRISAELEKVRCKDENWLTSTPIDNVWNMKLYRGKPNSISEAVNILKDLHIPSMLNDPSALIYATVELDLKLKKKDKFLDEFNGIITFPHEFKSLKQNRIVVVCKEAEDQRKASEAGAIFTGSTTLIKQILSGSLSSQDFDYVVCHPDMYKQMNTLRGILKRKYPSANNGLLRLDVDRAVTSFMKGIEYTLKRSAIEADFGWVDVCIGRLNMSISQIEDNLKHALNLIEKHKPTGTSHPFVIRTQLWCEKSREKLKIPHWEYLPNYPENGVFLTDEDDKQAEKSG